jgi:hypothetical protein
MHQNNAYRILINYLLPLGCFIYYFSLCLHYYEARISYGDTAYYLFKIIQQEGFNIESGRAIAYFTQLLPVLSVKFDAPLTLVMKMYSLNLALVYLLLYGIIRWVMKSAFVAVAILLLISQLQHYSFYYASPEHLLGTAWFLMLAFYVWKKTQAEQLNKKAYAMFVVLSSGLYFAHPFLLLLLANFLVLIWVYKPDRRLLPLLMLTVLITLTKYFFRTGYEGDHYAAFALDKLNLGNLKESYLTFFFLESFNDRFALLKFSFYFFLLILLVRKKWLLLIVMPLSLLSAYTLIYWMIPNGESLGYMECYLVMGVAAVFSFMVCYADTHLPESVKNPVLLMVFIACFAGLFRNKSEPLYKERVKYIKQLLDSAKKEGAYKAWIKQEHADYTRLLLDWSFPYETLLLSAQYDTAQTLIIDRWGIDYAATNKSNVFYGATWQLVNYDFPFNKRYFNLPEQAYREFVPKK